MSLLDAADLEAKAALNAARKADRKKERKKERKTEKETGDLRSGKRKPKKERKAERNAEKGTGGVSSGEQKTKRKATKQKEERKTKKAKLAVESDDAYLKAHEITIHEEGAPSPCRALRDAPFPAPLVKLLGSQGFTEPSAVQAAAWPLAVVGRDVLAIAKTGSGKTLGFLLPVLARCYREMKDTPERKASVGGPFGIIMAPTRELALQIHAEAVKFGKCVGCRSVAIYGGAARDRQVEALQRGCELIIGTPGRIKDVLDTRGKGRHAVCSVSSMSILVLDEADRMLDMGFEVDIRDIVWQTFGERVHQTFLFSATWPLGVQSIAHDLLTDAVKVTVGSGGEKLTANKSVTQRVHVIANKQRMEKFAELIRPFKRGGKDAGKRVIVFANMKVTVKKLVQYCQNEGMSADSMSGDRSQSQRESTVRKFKDGRVTVVVATDVAARGLDIKGIERVINYELPVTDFQDYVHRIGRTGRAGATGEADSLFTDGDRMHSQELIRIMKEAGQDVSPMLAKFAPTKIVFNYDSDALEEQDHVEEGIHWD